MVEQSAAKATRVARSDLPWQDEPTVSDVAISATVVAGLLDAIPDGLVMIDASGRMVLVNTPLEQMLGYRRSEMLGRDVEMLLPEWARGRHVEHRRDYLANTRVRPMGLGLTLRARRCDGSELPVEISLSPLDADGTHWVIATVRDDTERRAVEEDRREAVILSEHDRIADDLADTVIRALFGTGLRLQGLLDLANDHVRDGLGAAIADIDETIRDIRTVVFGLGEAGRRRGG